MNDTAIKAPVWLRTAEIEILEEALLPLPQVAAPLTHRFAPGVYLREIFMPKGTFIIGQRHTTEHFNIVLTGKARVLVGDIVETVIAPCVMKSGAGVRKVLYIEEDMRWLTVHPTEETDVEVLEQTLIVKSGAFTEHERQFIKAKGQYESIS